MVKNIRFNCKSLLSLKVAIDKTWISQTLQNVLSVCNENISFLFARQLELNLTWQNYILSMHCIGISFFPSYVTFEYNCTVKKITT